MPVTSPRTDEFLAHAHAAVLRAPHLGYKDAPRPDRSNIELERNPGSMKSSIFFSLILFIKTIEGGLISQSSIQSCDWGDSNEPTTADGGGCKEKLVVSMTLKSGQVAIEHEVVIEILVSDQDDIRASPYRCIIG